MGESTPTRWHRLRHLRLRYEATPYFADETFIAGYAMKHKQELLAARTEILQEYVAFYESDRFFAAYLKASAPHLLTFALWRVRALALAERLDLEAQPPIQPPRKKHTAEEIRAQIVRRTQVKAEDKIERTRAKINAILKARTLLDEYDLDPDERQMLEQDLIDDILKEDTDGDHAKTL